MRGLGEDQARIGEDEVRIGEGNDPPADRSAVPECPDLLREVALP